MGVELDRGNYLPSPGEPQDRQAVTIKDCTEELQGACSNGHGPQPCATVAFLV